MLNSAHPGIKDRLCDETGELRRFVNIYVNEEDIVFLKGKTPPSRMAMRFPLSRQSREGNHGTLALPYPFS